MIKRCNHYSRQRREVNVKFLADEQYLVQCKFSFCGKIFSVEMFKEVTEGNRADVIEQLMTFDAGVREVDYDNHSLEELQKIYLGHIEESIEKQRKRHEEIRRRMEAKRKAE